MSNAPQEVTIKFNGDAANLVAATNQVTSALGRVGASTGAMSAKTVALGTSVGNIMSRMALSAASMAKGMMSSFEDIGNQVYKMQLVMGGSAEELSKLRYAAQMVGVDSVSVSRAMGIASVAISHNTDKWKQLGIASTDSQGRTRPAVDLLADLSDRFVELGGSIDRTAAMKQVFGRGFAQVEPLLNLGGDAIRRFGDEAERMGLVLSDKDVAASREFSGEMRMLKGSLQGVFVSLGREVIPVLGAFVGKVTDAVAKLRDMWKEGGVAGGVLKTLSAVLGIVAAAWLAYQAAVGAATLAMKIFKLVMIEVDGVMVANPIGLVIIAIVALIAAVVWLAKTHAEFGDQFAQFVEFLVTYYGTIASVGIKSFKLVADAAFKMLEMLDLVQKKTSNWASKFAGAAGLVMDFFNVGSLDIEDLRAKMDDFDAMLNSAADTAWNAGKNYGEKWGKGLWEALRNLKVPSMKDLFPDWSGATTDMPEIPTGAGGTSAIEEAKKRILDFFTNLVRTSRDALNELRRAAVEARKQMREEATKIAQTLRDSFNITDMVANTWAKYLGVNALMRGFRRKLDQMKQFVADIRQLKTMGLPVEMLAQIANAGVEGGSAAARLLVQHPEAISELQKIQQEITTTTAQAGVYVSNAVFGEQVSAKEAEAIRAQLQYRGYVDSARRIGYQPSAEDMEAYNANIHNEVTINATTMADAKQIADAVAWALKTGIGLGMTPATTPPTPTGYKKPAATTTSTFSTIGGTTGVLRS